MIALVKTHENSKHGKEAALPSLVPGGSESVESLGPLVDRLLGDRAIRENAEASLSFGPLAEADDQDDSDSSGGQDAPAPSGPPPPVPGGNESITKGKDPPGENR